MKKYWLIGGGVATLGAIYFAHRKSTKTVSAIQNAVAGLQENAAGDIVSIPTGQTGPTVAIHATGYWPYAASDSERLMEGGIKDRKGRKILLLDDWLVNPGKQAYVSVAGDYTLWPDGQRIALSPWPGVVFRVVDTGGHFFGPKKVYRIAGEEPLDIAVASSKTIIPKHDVVATIFPGDNFVGGKQVAYSGFKGQTVAGDDVSKLLASLMKGRV